MAEETETRSVQKIQIKNRWTGAVIREVDGTIDEYGRADLRDADLRDADLRDADLSGAVLRGADLRDAVLSGAVLRGADLRDADLSGAVLRGAVLRDADLSGAVLRGAVLRDAVLRDAVLSDIRADLFDVLSCAPAEVPGLLVALKEGRIDGTVYSGQCACLVGTIAQVRGCDYESIPGLKPDSRRPAERWFLAIMPGNTPENHPVAKITAEWIEEWLAGQTALVSSVLQQLRGRLGERLLEVEFGATEADASIVQTLEWALDQVNAVAPPSYATVVPEEAAPAC